MGDQIPHDCNALCAPEGHPDLHCDLCYGNWPAHLMLDACRAAYSGNAEVVRLERAAEAPPFDPARVDPALYTDLYGGEYDPTQAKRYTGQPAWRFWFRALPGTAVVPVQREREAS